MSAVDDAPATTAVALDLQALLGALVERDVTVGSRPATEIEPAVVGLLALPGQPPDLALVLDLPLAAHAGAALTRVPAGVVAECVRRRVLDETLFENAAEILNVLRQLTHHVDRARRDLVALRAVPAGEPAGELADPRWQLLLRVVVGDGEPGTAGLVALRPGGGAA